MHVITSLHTGGAEGMLTRLVTRNSALGKEQMVVSLTPGGAYRTMLEASGVSVMDLGMRRGIPSAKALGRLVGLIRAFGPEIIQTWLYHADLLATLALTISGRRQQTQLVWGIRCSNLDFRHYPRCTGFVVRLLTKLSTVPDAILSNSEAGRRAHVALGYRPSGWTVIPNGIDVERFRRVDGAREACRRELELPEDAFVVGLCARNDPMKDHETFVSAANHLAAQWPSAKFVLIGAGTDEKESALSRIIDGSPFAARFCRLGERNDIPRLLSSLDVATLSSAFGEGFPNALAEAMACEVPCVTTDSGDAAEVVGDTGIVVPVGAARALAEGWLCIAKLTYRERRELGELARERVIDRFSLPCVDARFAAFYESVIHATSVK